MGLFISKNAYFRHFFRTWARRWPAQSQFILVRVSKNHYRLHFFDEEPELFAMSPEELVRETCYLGPRLRAWRIKHKISLKEASMLSGIHETNISAIEKGRRGLGENLARRIEALIKK